MLSVDVLSEIRTFSQKCANNFIVFIMMIAIQYNFFPSRKCNLFCTGDWIISSIMRIILSIVMVVVVIFIFVESKFYDL